MCGPFLPLCCCRRLQLEADLPFQGSFLEQYQGYLARLVGYFLVEDAVLAQAGPGVAAAHCIGAADPGPGSGLDVMAQASGLSG